MQKCPNALCGRTGDEIGQCGSFVICPRTSVPVPPTDVVLHCSLCEITRAIPAGSIMKGKGIEGHSCKQAECCARPIATTAPRPAKAPQKAVQPKPAEEPVTDGDAQEG